MSDTRPARVVRYARPDGSWRELVLDGVKITIRGGFAAHVNERQMHRFPTELAASERFAALSADSPEWPQRLLSERDLPRSKWNGLQPGAVNPELEAALDAADDRSFGAAARVYTDWLLSEGDPRGELAAHLQANGSADEFLSKNGEALLGDLDGVLGQELDALEWHAGLLRSAELRGPNERGRIAPSLEELTARLLSLPVARFVIRLRFGLAIPSLYDNDWRATLAAVAESNRAPFLRELRFDAADAESLTYAELGNLSGHWHRFPRLESLVIAGSSGALGELDLPSLQNFVRISEELDIEQLDSISRAKWPALERLELEFGRAPRAQQPTVDQLPALLANPMPKLTHLGLRRCTFTAKALELLAASPVFARLKSLDLSSGSMTDADVGLILRLAPGLKRLTLDLSQNCFSDEAVRALAAALPYASIWHQRREIADEYE